MARPKHALIAKFDITRDANQPATRAARIDPPSTEATGHFLPDCLTRRESSSDPGISLTSSSTKGIELIPSCFRMVRLDSAETLLPVLISSRRCWTAASEAVGFRK